MAKIDIDKFVSSFIPALERAGFSVTAGTIRNALKAQGLECKDGKLQEIADTQEPKFKVGDWIVFKNDSIYYVNKVFEHTYELIINNGDRPKIPFYIIDKVSRLWTIQDAKDGDVLMANAPFIFNGNLDGGIGCPGAYCAINTLGNFQIPNKPTHWTGHNTCPATKEQRDLLFQKMHEAGYEWDEKELKLEKIKPEVDIDAMVKEYRNNLPLGDYQSYGDALAEAFKQGLENMYNLMKK